MLRKPLPDKTEVMSGLKITLAKDAETTETSSSTGIIPNAVMPEVPKEESTNGQCEQPKDGDLVTDQEVKPSYSTARDLSTQQQVDLQYVHKLELTNAKLQDQLKQAVVQLNHLRERNVDQLSDNAIESEFRNLDYFIKQLSMDTFDDNKTQRGESKEEKHQAVLAFIHSQQAYNSKFRNHARDSGFLDQAHLLHIMIQSHIWSFLCDCVFGSRFSGSKCLFAGSIHQELSTACQHMRYSIRSESSINGAINLHQDFQSWRMKTTHLAQACASLEQKPNPLIASLAQKLLKELPPSHESILQRLIADVEKIVSVSIDLDAMLQSQKLEYHVETFPLRIWTQKDGWIPEDHFFNPDIMETVDGTQVHQSKDLLQLVVQPALIKLRNEKIICLVPALVYATSQQLSSPVPARQSDGPRISSLQHGTLRTDKTLPEPPAKEGKKRATLKKIGNYIATGGVPRVEGGPAFPTEPGRTKDGSR